MRRKKFIIISCILVTLVILLGNLMIFLEGFVNSVPKKYARTIENPIKESLNPGSYYDYPLKLDGFDDKKVDLLISLENTSELDSSFIMLEVISDKYYSGKLTLNHFINNWQTFSFLVTNETVYLRFSMPKEVGNEASNLDLNFIIKVKVNQI